MSFFAGEKHSDVGGEWWEARLEGEGDRAIFPIYGLSDATRFPFSSVDGILRRCGRKTSNSEASKLIPRRAIVRRVHASWIFSIERERYIFPGLYQSFPRPSYVNPRYTHRIASRRTRQGKGNIRFSRRGVQPRFLFLLLNVFPA